MTTIINKLNSEGERQSVASARAAVMRVAEAQGIRPFTALEDFAGDTEITADFDVDQFLRQVREDRDRPSTHGEK